MIGVHLWVPAVFVLVSALVAAVHARRRRFAAEPAGATPVDYLVHAINDDRCTGCETCVSACPTKVLELIDHKSRVVRFEDCVQCEACARVCPTQALVMHKLDETPPPIRLPAIDANFETPVPGQYLIGEVAGKPLVKNAANLGRFVVEHMRANGLRAGAGGAGSVDVAIVGSGPAGLSAALSCIHSGYSYVLIEKEQVVASTVMRYPKGKPSMAEPADCDNVSLLPVFDATKEELVAAWTRVLDGAGVRVSCGEAVEAITRRDDGGFDVRTNVAAYRAQRVVIATGTRGKPRTLGIPGENLPQVHSRLDDPAEFASRDALVVGGGDSALEAAVALAGAGARVTLAYRGRALSRAQKANRAAVDREVAAGRIDRLPAGLAIVADRRAPARFEVERMGRRRDARGVRAVDPSVRPAAGVEWLGIG
ncbi:MAG: FAD-binding protein [Deltaproteobacteria bacterium]|nr:MAG: FAD-binding protein [Deltaproteobacteria bacterium]